MDQTVAFYDTHAASIAETYEGVSFGEVLDGVLPWLPESGTLLEIGSGSGRDAAFWLSRGFDVSAVDGSAGMIEQAVRFHPELAGRIVCHRLPAALPFGDGSFDVVVSMAMIMHLPLGDLPQVFAEVARVLRPGGGFAYSVNTARSGLDADGLDERGRRFTCLSADGWAALHEGAGLSTVSLCETDDVTGRPGIRWATFVCRKEPAG